MSAVTPGEGRDDGHDHADEQAWSDADFTTSNSKVWPPAWEATDFWMVHKGGKLPFAPWGDRDHPEGDPEKDARYKWGLRENWASKDTADEWVAMDPEIAGHVALLSEDDPFLFIDGDDVRDPETGDVHPAFRALLDRLGLTYADVSTSGAGVHALFAGDLPADVTQAVFDLDDEPWGTNDEVPSVEMYDHGRVCVATGEHVPGTPQEARHIDADGLVAVLDEYVDDADRGQGRGQTAGHDTDRDLDLADYEPGASASDETATDVRDVLAAVDRLRARDLPLRTRQVGHDATGWEQWDPSTYRSSAGGDSLHSPPDEPVFHDQKTGHSFGVLSLFAAEQGIISKPLRRLAGDEWWAAVDAARDAGAPIPVYEGGRGDAQHVPMLPDPDPLRRAASEWDWQRAATRDDRDLTLDDARERTTAAIADAYERRDRTLIEALPAMGKSYGAIAAAAETDTQVTFLTGRGQNEQYEQVGEWCAEHGLRHVTLPSFMRDCLTANGESGDEWRDRVRRWYERGATPQQIHALAETVLNRPLPCQDLDGQRCPYTAKWDTLDLDEYDVLIGHYTHAHVPNVVERRTVVVDEHPGNAYETTLVGPGLQGAVSYWLGEHDAVPFDDYTELIEHRDDAQRRADALAWFFDDDGNLAVDTDDGHVFDDESAHATAPLAVFALLTADDLGNGWERASFPDGGVAARDRETGALSLLGPPPLDCAAGVVALDGTPTPDMWERALGTRLTHRQVLDDDERADYIRDALNLNIVQTTDAVKSYSAGEAEIANRVSVGEDTALLEAIADRHDQPPAVITTNRAERVYEDAGAFAHASTTRHYGDVLGSNDFDSERVGAVLGSRNFGPAFVKKWGAYLGATVDPTFPCPENDFAPADYGDVGNQIRTHMRDHETLQAAMRFGRDGNGAVVYVHTDTLPDWVPREQGRVVKAWSDGMVRVLGALDDLDGDEWTTADVAAYPGVDLSRQQVFAHLETLRDRGVLARRQNPADGRGVVWRDDGLHRVGDHGAVELPAVDLDALTDSGVRKLARISVYRARFTNTGDASPGAAGGRSPALATDGGRDARETHGGGGSGPPPT